MFTRRSNEERSIKKRPVETTGARSMEFATKTIHAGQPSEPETGSLIAPIFQTSTYEQDEPGVNRGFDYSRTTNPTRARLDAGPPQLQPSPPPPPSRPRPPPAPPPP